MIIKARDQFGWLWIDAVERVIAPSDETKTVIGLPEEGGIIDRLQEMHLVQGEVTITGELRIHEPDSHGNSIFVKVLHYRVHGHDWNTLVLGSEAFLLNDDGATISRLR